MKKPAASLMDKVTALGESERVLLFAGFLMAPINFTTYTVLKPVQKLLQNGQSNAPNTERVITSIQGPGG